ncbi:Hemolymph lipopolysaccharide-binding protein [Gryllus bimaculatus]|nr:Hemolymph lipopolysaccharide-binding protein [Gryllus bimaculatus]
MIVWVSALVALVAGTSDVQGTNIDLCARMCPSSQSQCPTPCQPCPSCPSCPAVHCPTLPPIPPCPVPPIHLTCPTTPCICPACPPPPKCNAPPQVIPRGYTTVPGFGTYKLYPDKMKWLDANLTCAHDGGYLVIPNSLDELNYLLTLMADNGIRFIHVGFQDIHHENAFLTAVDQPMDAIQRTLWGDSEPDGGRDHNCVYLHLDKRRLMDEPCKDAEAFVCEISHT